MLRCRMAERSYTAAPKPGDRRDAPIDPCAPHAGQAGLPDGRQREAENLLVTHPKVFDVAVFGVPNEVRIV